MRRNHRLERIFAPEHKVPKTDQTDCFNVTGHVVPCQGTGQDGAVRAGEVWPTPRFVSQKETAVDRLTGLMWARDASLSHFPLSWREALAFVEELNRSQALGYTGWRLPNRKELFSLVSHVHINPSLPVPRPFLSIFSGYYWTCTTCVRLPRQAWYVHLGGGRVFKGMKHGSYMVWPVRGGAGGLLELPQTGQKGCFDEGGEVTECTPAGQDGALQVGASWPKPRFFAEGDTVTDRLTGLMWTRDANIGPGSTDWHSAFRAVRRLNENNAGGYNDWRLPNIRELESLSDMGSHSPALPAGHPFQGIGDCYWSSTTSTYDPRYAWVLYLEDGAVGVGYKEQSFCLAWAVRGC